MCAVANPSDHCERPLVGGFLGFAKFNWIRYEGEEGLSGRVSTSLLRPQVNAEVPRKP